MTEEPDTDSTSNNGTSTVCVSFQSFEAGQKRVEVTFSHSNVNNQLTVAKKQKTSTEMGSSFSSITPSPSPSSRCSRSSSEDDYEMLMDYALENDPSEYELDAFSGELPTFQYLGHSDSPSRGRKWVDCLDSAVLAVGHDRCYRLFLPEIQDTLGGTALEWWKNNVKFYSNWSGVKQAFIRRFLDSCPSPVSNFPTLNHSLGVLRTDNNVDSLVHNSTAKTISMSDSEVNTSHNLFTMSVVVKDRVLNCLLDSASYVNLITLRALELVNLLNQTKHLDPRHSPTFSKRYNTLLSSSVILPIEFPGYGETEIKHSSAAYVAQTLDQYDLILGLPFIRQHAQAINWTTHTFYHRSIAINKNPFLSEVA